MVIAMIAVLMVQSPLDEVVDVVAVRHGLMAAAGTMDVIGLVSLNSPLTKSRPPDSV